MDEEHKAAHAMGNILTSSMMRAYEGDPTPRTWLYLWERDGLQWLVRFRERHPRASVGNDWMSTFLALNRDAIMSEDERMDFNLKAYDNRVHA